MCYYLNVSAASVLAQADCLSKLLTSWNQFSFTGMYLGYVKANKCTYAIKQAILKCLIRQLQDCA